MIVFGVEPPDPSDLHPLRPIKWFGVPDMAKSMLARLIGLLLMTLALAGCDRNPDTYHYKLTLTLRVNGALRTGHSLVEVSPRYRKGLDVGQEDHTVVHGQATVVDLGNGRYLFGLLNGKADEGRRLHCPLDCRHGIWLDHPTGLLMVMNDLRDYRQIKTLSGVRPLELGQLPSLVTFKDIHDPSTAVPVDPHNFQQSLGNDVTFVGATLELGENEPVTTGIERLLPWLKGRGVHLIDAHDAICSGICYRGSDFERGNSPIYRFLMRFD